MRQHFNRNGSSGGLYGHRPRLIPPDANTQLYWKLDDAASPWVNSGLAGSLNMTSGGGTAPNALYPGLFLGSVSMSSTHGLQTSNTSVGETSGSWSMSIWVWPRAFGGTNFSQIFGKAYRNDGTWTAPFAAIDMNYTNANDGTWQANCTIAGVNKNVVNNSIEAKLVLNQWQLISCTFDKNTLTAYRNGFQVGTVSCGSNVSVDFGTHGLWLIGGHAAVAGEDFNGLFCDARFDWVVRSAAYYQKMFMFGRGWLF